MFDNLVILLSTYLWVSCRSFPAGLIPGWTRGGHAQSLGLGAGHVCEKNCVSVPLHSKEGGHSLKREKSKNRHASRYRPAFSVISMMARMPHRRRRETFWTVGDYQRSINTYWLINVFGFVVWFHIFRTHGRLLQKTRLRYIFESGAWWAISSTEEYQMARYNIIWSKRVYTTT